MQRVTRDALTPEQHARYARVTGSALLAAWPAVGHAALARVLRAGTAALAHHAEDALRDGGCHVLVRAGRSLGESGSGSRGR